jgi:hypothetical protein
MTMSDDAGAVRGKVTRKPEGKAVVSFRLVSKERKDGRVVGRKVKGKVRIGRWDALWPEFLEELTRLSRRYGIDIERIDS